MKKLEMIIRIEKFEELKKVLNDLDVKGMTVTNVMGCGNQKGSTEMYRGTEVEMSLLHKIKVEVVVSDSVVDKVIKEAIKAVKTGDVGDGKIFVFNMENVIRIRTEEQGESAI